MRSQKRPNYIVNKRKNISECLFVGDFIRELLFLSAKSTGDTVMK